MRSISIVVITCFFVFSCTDSDDNIKLVCGVGNPVKDLVWLKKEIENREQSTSDDIRYCYIVQAELEGRTVFLYEDCNPAINKVIPVYNCQGTLLGVIRDEIQMNSLSNFCVIWRPDDFSCLINFVCVRDN